MSNRYSTGHLPVARLVWLLAFGAGCGFPAIDYVGKTCEVSADCPSDLLCDPSSRTCQSSATPGLDASQPSDASTPVGDASAATEDAGPSWDGGIPSSDASLASDASARFDAGLPIGDAGAASDGSVPAGDAGGSPDASLPADSGPAPSDAGRPADAALPATCVHGTCTAGPCTGGCDTCDTGWAGANCDACDATHFGATCAAVTCVHGTCLAGTCSGLTGDGLCDACDTAWTGAHCDEAQCIVVDDFESGSLAGWTASGSTPPSVTADAAWLIEGAHSLFLMGTYGGGSTVTWPSSYPGNSGETAYNYAVDDAVVFREFVPTPARPFLSMKARSSIGHTSSPSEMYDHNRVNVLVDGVSVQQWDTGNLAGGIATSEYCGAPTESTLFLDLTPWMGKTLTVYARAHHGGWCGMLSLDSIATCPCRPGWTGPGCGACDASHFGASCAPVTCAHGACGVGTCSGLTGAGTCDSCQANWAGPNCGTCTPGRTGPQCDACDATHFGASCAPVTCSHGACASGTCSGLTGTGTCDSCQAGWAGPNCDTCDATHFGASCGAVTCVHGACGVGTCSGLAGSGTCDSCETDWIGPNCDQPRCVVFADFEAGGLAGWTASGTVPPATTSDPVWLIDGASSAIVSGSYGGGYTVTWPSSYPGNSGETAFNYAVDDAILSRSFVPTALRPILTLKTKSSIGHTTSVTEMYDHNRVNVLAGGVSVMQWDTGNLSGGLPTSELCAAPTPGTLVLDLTPWLGQTLSLYARAHSGGWCATLALDSIMLCK